MSKYLLLRSNKQTGPYTLDEMRDMGLKAYDLVWIDGKSAAWRYPGEIEELKPFSPPVEEQPFDRFFKRPTQINQPLFPHTPSQTTLREERVAELPKTKPEMAPIESKAVFASLPTEKAAVAEARPAAQRQNFPDRPTSSPIKEQNNSVRDQKEYMPRAVAPAEALSAKREILWEEESFAPASKVARNVPQIQRQASQKESLVPASFLKPFSIGFGLAAFLGIGVFIGLQINNRGNSTPKDIAVKEDLSGPSRQAFYRPKNTPRSGTEEILPDKKTENVQPAESDPNAANAEALALARKKARAKQRISDSLKLVKPAPVVDSGAIVAATQVIHATESINLKKDLVKNNISEYVSLTGNNYSVGTFGGISDLQLTISNRSTYPLDLVVVEVQYIQSNKKIFKTENIYFRNINAGAALMEEAPKSSRGVKVQYKITLINSKELGLAYSGI
ncbi:MAG: hypothetical protein ACHQEM_10200 [Chitinophagales bacterium]